MNQTETAGAGATPAGGGNNRHRQNGTGGGAEQASGALLEAALAYAARGWAVMPVWWVEGSDCACPADKCDRPGKHPICKHGVRDATADAKQARLWWHTHPRANIGIACGDPLVLDVDPRNGGHDTLEALEAELGRLPETVTADTGGGGQHLYFQAVGDAAGGLRGTLGPGVDVKAQGGYVVAPPSSHLSGTLYGWHAECAPDEIPPAALPAAWLEAVVQPATPEADPAPCAVPLEVREERARRYVAKMPIAVSGEGGHERAFAVARVLIRGFQLPVDRARVLLREYSSRCKPPWSDREVEHKLAQAATRARVAWGYLLERGMAPVGEGTPPGAPEAGSGDERGGTREPRGGDGGDGGGVTVDIAREPGEWTRQEGRREELRVDEHETEWALSDAVLDILSRDQALYVRGRRLARITRSAEDGSAIIDDVGAASLRELVDDRIIFLREGGEVDKDGKKKLVPIAPPGACLRAIAARRQYLGLRQLSCIVTAPTFRDDGTLITEPGYDAAANMYYRPAGPVVLPPENPTRDDGLAALTALEDVLCDFPFASEADKSVALAIALTPPVRKMVGNAPMFVADGNVRGVGKGLLINVLLVIATGRIPAPYALPEDDAEMRKRLTALAREGRSVVLFDNVTRKIKFASLDMALTNNGLWGDRILGANEAGEWELRPTWLVTANNLELGNDAGRRTLAVRLVSPHENPEDRSDLKRADLLQWVQTERPRLAGELLTVWRAFFAAGRPQKPLPSWGSFEAWSALVRQVLVWLDRADPWQTRAGLRERADVEREAILALYTEMARVCGKTGLSARAILAAAATDEALREAVLGIARPAKDAPLPTSHVFSVRLRSLRDKPVGGLRLGSQPGHAGVHSWWAEAIDQGGNPTIPTNPTIGSEARGGDGGDGGVPAAGARNGSGDPFAGADDEKASNGADSDDDFVFGEGEDA